jgi:hypothetical protein
MIILQRMVWIYVVSATSIVNHLVSCIVTLGQVKKLAAQV